MLCSGSIRFFSSNLAGLKQVSLLLNKNKFRHTLLGPYKKEDRQNQYVLQLSRAEKVRFLKTINPISKRPGKCGGIP